MKTVKILGAGSAGNHFAHAFRRKGWDVFLTDVDPHALERTRSETYPQRYDQWDPNIRLGLIDDAKSDGTDTPDVTVLATPPEFHVRLALNELTSVAPKILLIEKPFSGPGDPLLPDFLAAARRTSTQILVGYNHNLSQSVAQIVEALPSIGEVHSINVDVRENSQFILNAHPWLKDVGNSYLGFAGRGGGAGFEHSHGVALWYHLAEAAGLTPLARVYGSQRASDDGNFDFISAYMFEDARGHCGSVVQDFLSAPPLKRAEIFGRKGRITWTNVFRANHEEIIIATGDDQIRRTYPKQRETDFVNEVEHLEKILEGQTRGSSSPVSLSRGIAVQRLLELGTRASERRAPQDAQGLDEL